MKKNQSPFRGFALAGFCLQISLLYQSAVPIYEGLSVMSEDAETPEVKEIFSTLSNKLRLGCSFSDALKETECFPSYMVEMIVLGEQTGTLDVTLKGLSSHYEKEARLAESLRRTFTYPIMMVSMLLIILFVLFTKVMPIFTDVYAQLGAQVPPVALAAIRLGSFVSGLALVLLLIFIIAAVTVKSLNHKRKHPPFLDSMIHKISARSSIPKLTALRRICSTMSVTLRCGLPMEEGLAMAEKLMDHPQLKEQIRCMRESILQGENFYDAIKKTGLLSGFDLQLIRVANRTGQLESILSKMADDYEEKESDTLDSIVARTEPVVVTILAIAVGLVLLSVMLPLAGILSAIG